jgi:hypothetical protein
MWQVVNSTPRPLYPRERDPVPIVQEAGWAQGPVWTGAENLAITGIHQYTVLIEGTSTICIDQMQTYLVLKKVHFVLASKFSTLYNVV